jgi:hypothetical protein
LRGTAVGRESRARRSGPVLSFLKRRSEAPHRRREACFEKPRTRLNPLQCFPRGAGSVLDVRLVARPRANHLAFGRVDPARFMETRNFRPHVGDCLLGSFQLFRREARAVISRRTTPSFEGAVKPGKGRPVPIKERDPFYMLARQLLHSTTREEWTLASHESRDEVYRGVKECRHRPFGPGGVAPPKIVAVEVFVAASLLVVFPRGGHTLTLVRSLGKYRVGHVVLVAFIKRKDAQ